MNTERPSLPVSFADRMATDGDDEVVRVQTWEGSDTTLAVKYVWRALWVQQ